jgi:hypothetical protein
MVAQPHLGVPNVPRLSAPSMTSPSASWEIIVDSTAPVAPILDDKAGARPAAQLSYLPSHMVQMLLAIRDSELDSATSVDGLLHQVRTLRDPRITQTQKYVHACTMHHQDTMHVLMEHA